MFGVGTFTWPNGNVYDGQWKEDRREGTGTQRDMDGSVYAGQWLSNKKHGKGKSTRADFAVYEGARRQHSNRLSAPLAATPPPHASVLPLRPRGNRAPSDAAARRLMP